MYIESINIKSVNDKTKGESCIKLTEMSSAPSTIVRPSSLNYKISLNEATIDFVKKEMPIQDDQFIDVQLEDPKFDNAAGKAADHKEEDFDDAMFDMTVSINVGRKANASKNTDVYINEDGQTKDAWFREED